MRFALLKAAGVLLALALAGCSNEPPKCTDPQTLELVKSIFADMVSGDKFVDAGHADVVAMTAIELPSPSDYNEKVKKFTCEARLRIVPPTVDIEEIRRSTDEVRSKAVAVMTRLNLSTVDELNGNCSKDECTASIKFSSQNVEDRHQVGVSEVPTRLIRLAGLYASLKSLTGQATRDRMSKEANPPKQEIPATPEQNSKEEFVQTDPAKSASVQRCIKVAFGIWEEKYDARVAENCAELAKKGEECRVSAGAMASEREFAMDEISKKCQ